MMPISAHKETTAVTLDLINKSLFVYSRQCFALLYVTSGVLAADSPSVADASRQTYGEAANEFAPASFNLLVHLRPLGPPEQ
jgi:hypothetical protein